MTIAEVLKTSKAKDGTIVEYRMKEKFSDGHVRDTWVGSCRYSNGSLVPCSGDSYGLNTTVEGHYIGTSRNLLTIYIPKFTVMERYK